MAHHVRPTPVVLLYGDCSLPWKEEPPQYSRPPAAGAVGMMWRVSGSALAKREVVWKLDEAGFAVLGGGVRPLQRLHLARGTPRGGVRGGQARSALIGASCGVFLSKGPMGANHNAAHSYYLPLPLLVDSSIDAVAEA